MKSFKKALISSLAGAAMAVAGASAAFAGDTTELLDPGVVEVAPAFSLTSLHKDDKPAVSFGTAVGYGVTDFMSIFVNLGIGSGEALADLEFDLSTDLLFTPVDTDNFDFDVHISFGSTISAAQGITIVPGFELNYDSDNDQSGFGAYLRFDLPISSARKTVMPDLTDDDEDDNDDEKVESDVGIDLTLGLYYSVMEGHQLFLEGGVSFANLAENYAPKETEGFVSLGYNAVIVENFELVSEVKIIIPEDDHDATNAEITIGGIFDIPTL